MNIQDISNGMMNVVRLGMSEEAKIAYALSGLTVAGVATGYTMHKRVVGPAQSALTNCIESHSGKWKSYALMSCDFLVGRQAKATKVVPFTPKGAANLALQAVEEAATRIQQETYELHAAKFKKKEADPDNSTLLKKLVGEHEVVKKVEEKITNVENKVACAAAYGYKQTASHVIVPVAELGIKYCADKKSLKALEGKKEQGALEKVGSTLVEGAQVKVKQEVADWVEKHVDTGATWAGHATAKTLKVALVDALVLQVGNHQLARGGVSVTEILNADSVSEGVSRLLSIGVRELTHSSLLSSAAYIGGRLGFLTGEILIQAYQNQLMLEAEGRREETSGDSWNAPITTSYGEENELGAMTYLI